MPNNVRSKQDRIEETRPILTKLNELKLTSKYESVRDLLRVLREYVTTGTRQDIHIPFYVINRSIVGTLEVERDRPCVVKLVELD